MKKIPVNPAQAPLQNPFAALNREDFPEPPAGPPAPAQEARPKARGPRPRVVLRREKAERGGKTVIVAHGLPTHLSPSDLDNLLRQAKKALGCGGTLAGRELELQGGQADRVRAFFESKGFAVVGPG